MPCSATLDSDHYFDLGSHKWTVTSDSPDAQLWANRGLIRAYSSNHEEVFKCFEKAAKLDPFCATAHWGMAFCAGPTTTRHGHSSDIKTSSSLLV